MMESADSAPPSSPFPKSNPRINPSKTHNPQFCPFLLSFLYTSFFFFSFFFTTLAQAAAETSPITSSNFLAYYSNHCNDVVPESPISGPRLFGHSQDKVPYLDIAYFTGGHQIVPQSPTGGGGNDDVSLSFHPKRNYMFLTENPQVVHLQATLKFRFPFWFNATFQRRNLREIRFRRPRIPVRERSLWFELYGFLSLSGGKMCMVGSGSTSTNLGAVSPLPAVFKLDYPVNFSNVSSLIKGILESLVDKRSVGYFDPISVLGITQFGEYKYTLMESAGVNACSSENDDDGGRKNENLTLELLDPSMCLTQLYRNARNFELEYGNGCGSQSGVSNCNPLGGRQGILPRFMTIQGISCEHGSAIRVLIGFSNSGYYGFGSFAYERVFDPNAMMIGEGSWDEKENRLCVVACRVLDFKDSLGKASIGDCYIRLSLRFPRILTIRHRSTVVGQIWSSKTVNDTGYFNKIGFHGPRNKIRGLPGLKYEYTMLDRASKLCAMTKTVKGKGKTYPNGYSLNMRFGILVKNDKGQTAQGYSSFLFMGDQLFEPYGMNHNQSGPLNMSYVMRFKPTSDFIFRDKLSSNESVEISAEGRYDSETDVLCMIGCRHLILQSEKAIINDSTDCEIAVNIQFSPVDEKVRGNIKGTIRSMRGNSDPLYFGQIEISSKSIYRNQASESIWRMDMEITLVLISNTLACIFVALQIYHAKNFPDVVPFISMVMLVVLTLGHMIPLLLNFEALFMSNHNRQNVFLGSGGWLEVNEVIVRLVTMIAFLLHLRLLQLTWSSRKNDGSHKSLWLSEKKVVCLSLPLYIGGALVAWYVHRWSNSYKSPYLLRRRVHYKQDLSWGDLKSYAGLLLDGFLLPQILFNSFLNSKERALASPFYIGITIIRLLPHAYDLYRAHSSTWYLDSSYIYANHRQDFYSTAWDIVIPLGCLLFAVLVYLQQRSGGQCIFPKRCRYDVYEKVPAANGEELQEDIL